MTSVAPLPRSPIVLSAEVGDLMDHTPESAYAHLRYTRPEWFVTPPGDGVVRIERWPMTEGQVMHRDEDQVVLEDPVVLPDGEQGRRLRMLPARPEPPVAVLPLIGGDVVLVHRFRHAARTWQWEIPRGPGTEGTTEADNAARHLQHQLGATPSELIGLGRAHPDPALLAEPVRLYAARIDAVGDLAPATGIRTVRTVTFTEAERMAVNGQITDAVTITALFRARQGDLAAPQPRA
ncbi:NUDIX hydrolase [Streptomyces sp. NBC_00470]|uniref:NUDIX hydrolase n=1 Tax=Streptomyces sp. NBC_00470 TaxID=2975753 RepID=UPI002F90BFF1